MFQYQIFQESTKVATVSTAAFTLFRNQNYNNAGCKDTFNCLENVKKTV